MEEESRYGSIIIIRERCVNKVASSGNILFLVTRYGGARFFIKGLRGMTSILAFCFV